MTVSVFREKKGTGMIDLNDSIVSVFYKWVKDRPDHPAVIEDGKVLTYRDLYESAMDLAGRLASLGIGRGDVIPVIAKRDACYIEEILAVLMTGAAFAGVDESYPDERKGSISDQVNARFILRDRKVLDRDGREVHAEAEAAAGTFVIPNISPDDLAYVHFTSGTEGAPKGVRVQHRGSVQRTLWAVRDMGNTGDDVMLIKTKLSFIASIVEITRGFMTGSTMVILPEPQEKEPSRIVKAIYENKVTWMSMAPTMLAFVIKEAEREGPDMLASLRLVECAGEALKPAVAGAVLKALKNTRVINVYGQTETSCVLAAWHEVTEQDAANESIPLGKAPEGSSLYVMSDGKFCGDDEPGEICVGGLGLSLGYINEELTKKAFLLHEFEDGREPEVLYHTGDRGRWRSDGVLIGLGRSDSQVKIHGQRVELGEVENAVTALPDVRECTVTAVKNKKGDAAICAYIVTNSGSSDAAAFREALAQKLPEYMLPAHFVFMDGLPRNVNGKIDKTKLPEPKTERSTEYVAPRNELEEKICAAFEEALEAEKVGVHDSFYELGGDSLAAISLSTILEESLGKEVTEGLQVNEIIRAQTPEGVAAALSGGDRLCGTAALRKLSFDSHTQDQFDYMLSLRSPGSGERRRVEPTASSRIMLRRPHRTATLRIVFDRSVSVDEARSAAARAIDGTVYEYTFDSADDCFYQYPGSRKDIPVLDIDEITAESLVFALSNNGFAYDGTQLLADLFMINNKETGAPEMFAAVHHSITDRESTSILVEEINDILNGRDPADRQAAYPVPAEQGRETVSEEEYFRLTGELDRRIKDHPFTRVAVGRELDPSCFMDPIPPVMDLYLEMNPLLSDMKRVPLMVIISGRNAENARSLGCYLTFRFSVYDTEKKTLTDAPGITPDEEAEKAIEWTPQINYIGIFNDERSREEIYTIQKGFEKERYVHGSRYGNELVLKLPVYE